MKTIFLLLASLGGASAAVITVTDPTVGIIPDGSSSGVVRSLTVSAPGEVVFSAEVDIDISAVSVNPSFLGDLYLYLSNGTHLSVLANRSGRRAGTPAGYADNQAMRVTFSTLGAADLHNYRLTVTGSHATPLTGPLTGIWQPDARAVDPAVALDTSPRTAGLDLFTGDDATGAWTLFVADISTGGLHQLNTWTLRLNTVPEPGSTVLLFAAAALTMRRRR